MSNWELAYKDYKNGLKYREIADKYDVSINTVKSWKTRKWNKIEGVGIEKKGAHKVAYTKRVQPMIENDGLTENQKLFCLHYLQHFNATKAYQEVYQVDFKSARASGSRLLANVNVKAEIDRLKNELKSNIFLDLQDLMNECVRQLYADITDFVEFGQEVATNKEGESYLKSYLRFKDMDEVDGTLIDEIKLSRDGISIKMPSKQKAIDTLLKYLDTDTETDKNTKVINRGNDEMEEWLNNNH